MMKRIFRSFDLPVGRTPLGFLLALMVIPMACHKDDIKIVPPPVSEGSIYHVHFQFHGSGAPIPGIQAAAGFFRQQLISKFEYTGPVDVDQNGDVRFATSPYHRYLKVQNIAFDEDLYEVDTVQVNNEPMHQYLESVGRNVVRAKWTHRVGNDYYFTAEVYERPYVDIHLVQVSDIQLNVDQKQLNLQADLFGQDTGRIQNTFGALHVMPLVQWSPGRTWLDTTIRIQGFAGVQNMLKWTVYADGSSYDDDMYLVFPISTPKKKRGNTVWFIKAGDSSSTLTLTF